MALRRRTPRASATLPGPSIRSEESLRRLRENATGAVVALLDLSRALPTIKP